MKENKQYAFHYFVDGVHFIEILDFKPVCKGKEYCNEVVEVIPCDEKIIYNINKKLR